MFVPYAGEIWTKSYGPNYTKFSAFWPKKCFFFYNQQEIDAILKDVSVAEIISSNAKLII